MSSLNEITIKIGRNTLVCEDRRKVIYDSVISTKEIVGDMAEIGVYKGGTSYLISRANPNKILYACDSFEGLPQENKEIDTGHCKGDFSDVVYENVYDFLNAHNVKLIKGFFPDKVLHSEMYNKVYSFIHLDVDLYQPTLECLEFFYPRMSKGAILVSDDYLWRCCPGVKLAFDEFMKNKPEHLVDTGVLSCYFIKD